MKSAAATRKRSRPAHLTRCAETEAWSTGQPLMLSIATPEICKLRLSNKESAVRRSTTIGCIVRTSLSAQRTVISGHAPPTQRTPPARTSLDQPTTNAKTISICLDKIPGRRLRHVRYVTAFAHRCSLCFSRLRSSSTSINHVLQWLQSRPRTLYLPEMPSGQVRRPDRTREGCRRGGHVDGCSGGRAGPGR
jgi:hypothetical protein